MNKKLLFRVAFFIILAIGLFLRTYQYLLGRGLWEDECHLALNFMNYGFARLMQPLDYIQAAPALFILITKLSITFFGPSEEAFHLLPFVAGILTFPLFYFIVKEISGNMLTAVAAFLVFAVSLQPIYFASELKQYGTDLAVMLLLLFLAVSKHPYIERKRKLLLTICGCLGVFLSHIGFVPLICIGVYRLCIARNIKVLLKNDWAMYASWFAFTLANYLIFVKGHPSTSDQQFNYASAFCPIDIFSPEFVEFWDRTLEESFFSTLLMFESSYGFRYVVYILFLSAIVFSIAKKNYTMLIFTVLPILIHLILSAMKIYPFKYRLILYLVPSTIMLICYGMTEIGRYIGRLHWSAFAAFGIYCVAMMCVPSLKGFPRWPSDIFPALEYVNSKPPSHIYITEPIHTYHYYYLRGKARNDFHFDLPWNLTLQDLNELTRYEKTNFILFFGTVWQWGYGQMLSDLKASGRVLENYEGRGYGVFIVKPLVNTPSSESLVIDHTYFPEAKKFNESIVAIWGGSVESKPIHLKPGNYNLGVTSSGTKLEGVFPNHSLFANGTKIGEFTNTNLYTTSEFTLHVESDTAIIFRIKMENDAASQTEDRNSFLRGIEIRQQK